MAQGKKYVDASKKYDKTELHEPEVLLEAKRPDFRADLVALKAGGQGLREHGSHPLFLVIKKPYTNCLSAKIDILITIMCVTVNYIFLI